jgi:hypothetical protein
MVKSTPITQVFPQQQPQQKTIVQDTNEDINIEDLVQEKARLSSITQQQQQQQQQQQVDLQNQIELLKREIHMNKSQNVPDSVTSSVTTNSEEKSKTDPVHIEPKGITDSIINKNAMITFVNEFDYSLFVILIFILTIMYSETTRTFISQKLEIKNLAYLTPYAQSFISALLVVFIKKLN